MKRSSFIAVLAVALIISFLTFPAGAFAGGGATPLEKADRPVLNVGDTWIYQVEKTGEAQDRKYKLTMAVIANNGKEYAIAVDDGKEKLIEYYTLNLNFVRSTDEKGKIIEGCDEMVVFEWPLKQGGYWTREYFCRGDSGPTKTVTEDIRPETLINSEGQEVATLRLTFKRLNAYYGTVFSKRDVWHNPATKFIFKRVDERKGGRREVRELISFTPGTK